MDNKRILRKRGFTLTEALVVLTIIGIIAALVVPRFFKEYQQHELYARFTKTYESLNNLFPILLKENGSVMRWSDEDCANIVDKMPVIQECDTMPECFAPNGYRKIEEEERGVRGGRFSVPNIDATKNRNRPQRIAVLKNGAIVRVQMNRLDPALDRGNGVLRACFIAIDTNGKRGPNVYGKDFWIFEMRSYNKFVPHYGYDEFDNEGISKDYRAWMNEEERLQDCREEIGSLKFCAEYLMKNHKMDY